jgi:hypothetical protein
VNDVSTLMGKLKANVAYLQFNDYATEEKSTWPVLERMVRAQRFEAASLAPSAAPMAPAPAGAAPAPVAAAPANAAFALRLAATHLPEPAPAPAEPAAVAAAAPAPTVTAPAAGGILRRYSASGEAPQAAPAAPPTTAEHRVLADIFAQLERKAP